MELPVQVTIYYLPGCVYSAAIKQQVENRGWPCEMVNVLARPAVMNDLPHEVRTPLPTVRIGSRMILDATPEQVENALHEVDSTGSSPRGLAVHANAAEVEVPASAAN